MRKADLYEIAIKVLGLYSLVIVINQLRDVLILMGFLLQSWGRPEIQRGADQTPIFFVALTGWVILIIFSSLLIFRTKQITKLVSKPADYKDQITLFAEKKTIYEICLMLLGLVTIALTLPDFIVQLRNHIAQVQNDLLPKNPDKTFLITSGLKIAIALVAIIYSRQLSKLLTREQEHAFNQNG